MKKIILSSLLIIVLILPVTVFAQDLNLNSKQPADPNLKNKMDSNIVARINGEKITKKELAQKANTNQLLMQINQIDQQFLQTLTTTESGQKVLKEYQKQQLDNLINNLLLQQKAEEKGISLSQKKKEKLYQQQKNAIIKNNNLTQEKYLSILKNRGFKNEKEYKQQFFKNPQLKVNKLIEEVVVSDLNVTKSEIKNFYEKNKEQFTKDDKVQPLEKVKPQIKELLKQQKRNNKISQYVKNIREKAEITKNI
ncbi:SurA-like protein [Halanaerobium saccharolyticum]|uniref:peptidylprolyl isomerase n=1 Tax=Halanaerobium saccharolyticum TaxID=43595 RepID=A0A2T5RFV6_9FIRM|nr:SurA N-terminal domain-containing protein [Halanaerobium saccharolyticum]PTV93243.1 SurA-like protein [Halanaerobium saccharolyticum]